MQILHFQKNQCFLAENTNFLCIRKEVAPPWTNKVNRLRSFWNLLDAAKAQKSLDFRISKCLMSIVAGVIFEFVVRNWTFEFWMVTFFQNVKNESRGSNALIKLDRARQMQPGFHIDIVGIRSNIHRKIVTIWLYIKYIKMFAPHFFCKLLAFSQSNVSFRSLMLGQRRSLRPHWRSG